ncbi:hypothetical protein D6C82_04564 [Aureobasidium pullulans]|nr:hypothetical protein D6C82_04564 [Aureobasidium pullulans]
MLRTLLPNRAHRVETAFPVSTPHPSSISSYQPNNIVNSLSTYLTYSATQPPVAMTVLGEQETTEITRKVEALASTLLVPNESPGGEWKQHFRIDTDLQGIKSLLAEKRTRLPYLHLPDWHQNEVLHALNLVEACVKKMEVKHTRSVATDAVENLTFVDGDSASSVFSIVEESVTAVINSTLDEIRRGEVLAGAPASALQVAVGMVARQDVLDAVFQRANLEALGSEVAIKKHVVAALASLLQREMMRSIDGWSQRRNSCDIAALFGHGSRFEKLCAFCQLVGWPSHYMERGRQVLWGEYLFLVRKEGRNVLVEAIVQRRASLMLSSVLVINKHSINNLTLNSIMNSINLIDELKLSETLDTATIKIHDIQNDVNEPNVSKETINTAFTALTKIIEEIKTDLAKYISRSINARVGHAVDFAVSRTDSLPRLYAGLPNPDLPDWPEVRMGLVNQVKAKIEAHYYQLEGSMLMSLDPKVFEDQARKEASTIVFANVEEFPDDMAAELQENTHT